MKKNWPRYLLQLIVTLVARVLTKAFKGCLSWGSHTSILTPYLKSTGLFTPRVKFLSNSDQLLQRYSNIPAHCNVAMENLNLGNPSILMIYSSEVTPAAWHICYNINFKHNS